MTTAYQQGQQAFDERDWDEYARRNPYAGVPGREWLADQWEKGYDDANEAAWERRYSYNECDGYADNH